MNNALVSQIVDDTGYQRNRYDFPVTFRKVYVSEPDGGFTEAKNRLAIYRPDTKQTLSIVSNKYSLVRHVDIFDTIDNAVNKLGVGKVSRGIYVRKGGAKVEALYRFDDMRKTVNEQDTLCPIFKVLSGYGDGCRWSAKVGAYRNVCTNLSVGGPGAFSAGFSSAHIGTPRLDIMRDQFTKYLSEFDNIIEQFKVWYGRTFGSDEQVSVLENGLEGIPKKYLSPITRGWGQSATIWEAYNVATDMATHAPRSAAVAFSLLEKVNTGFHSLNN